MPGEASHVEGEDVIITFEKEGADTVLNFEGRITNIRMTGGTGEIETIRTFGGKSISVQKPTGDYEVSIDYITNDTRFSEINFDNTATQGAIAGQDYKSGSESNKKRWRVVVWFLGNGAGTSNTGTIVVPLKVGEMMRYIFKDVYSTGNEEEFASEEYFKGTITLKCAATDENGYGNVIKSWTPTYASTALPTVTSTSHGGTLTWNTTTPAWTGSYRT